MIKRKKKRITVQCILHEDSPKMFAALKGYIKSVGVRNIRVIINNIH